MRGMQLAAGVSLLALVAGQADAQNAPVIDVPAAVVQNDQSGRLDEITVYGTLEARPSFTYPGMITVVNREEIETRQPSNVYDTVRAVPNVDVPGGPRRNGQNPAIRGLGGQRTQILVDGARQSFSSAHDGRFFLDPELLRTVEVIRGPSSALYGSGAIGGVFALTTLNARDLLMPGETMGVRVRVGGQSVNREVLTSLTGFGAAGGWDILGNISRRASGNISLPGVGQLQSDDEIVSGMGKISFENANFGFTGQVIHYNGQSIEPDNPQGLNVASTTTPLVDREIRSTLYRGELRIHPEAAPWINTRIIPYFNTTSIDERTRLSGRFTTRDVETVGVSADNRTRFEIMQNLGGVFTVGFDTYRNEFRGTDSINVTGNRDGVPNASSRYFGAFTQLELNARQPLGLPGQLTVIPGVRYDTFTSSAESIGGENRNERLSPRVGATYQPVPWFLVFANYGQGFRAPDVGELYLGGTHFSIPHYSSNSVFSRIPAFSFLRTATISNVFVPNPNLLPETGTSAEAGVGLTFNNVLMEGDRLRAKASAFDSRVDDLINLSVNFPAPQATCFFPPFYPCSAGTTTSANIASARIRGVEVEAAYTSRFFDFALAYGAITGRDAQTGSFIGQLSPDRLFLDGAVKFPDLNLRVGARAEIAGDFRRANTAAEYRSGYELMDLYLVWEPRLFDIRGVRIDLGIDNVFDRRYERTFAGVVEPGRNYKGALSYRIAF